MKLHNLNTHEETPSKLRHLSHNPTGELIKLFTEKMGVIKRHRRINEKIIDGQWSSNGHKTFYLKMLENFKKIFNIFFISCLTN